MSDWFSKLPTMDEIATEQPYYTTYRILRGFTRIDDWRFASRYYADCDVVLMEKTESAIDKALERAKERKHARLHVLRFMEEANVGVFYDAYLTKLSQFWIGEAGQIDGQLPKSTTAKGVFDRKETVIEEARKHQAATTNDCRMWFLRQVRCS